MYIENRVKRMMFVGLMLFGTLLLSGCTRVEPNEKNDVTAEDITDRENDDEGNLKKYGESLQDLTIDDVSYYHDKAREVKIRYKEDTLIAAELWTIEGKKGFALYEKVDGELNQVIASVSTVKGHADTLVDLDNDGMFDGYVQFDNPLDMPEYIVEKHSEWVDEDSVITHEEFDLGDYPEDVDELVLQYYKLSLLYETYSDREISSRMEHINSYDIVMPKLDPDKLLKTFDGSEDGYAIEARYGEYYDSVIIKDINESGSMTTVCRIDINEDYNGKQTLNSAQEAIDLTEDNAIYSDDGETVTVHNANELVHHMASNKTFILMPGDYDMSGIDNRLNVEYFSWAFQNLENVKIQGSSDERLEVITYDMYYEVMSFTNCKNIHLENLYLGHEPMIKEYTCSGNVLYLNNVDGITIDNCDLFGCGVHAIYGWDINNLICNDSIFRDCSEDLIYIDSADVVEFNRCKFISRQSEHVMLSECSNVVFNDCTFEGFFAGYPNIYVNYSGIITEANDGIKHVIDTYADGIVTINNTSFIGENKLDSLNEQIGTLLGDYNAAASIYFDELEWQQYIYVEGIMNNIESATQLIPTVDRIRAAVSSETDNVDQDGNHMNTVINLEARLNNQLIQIWANDDIGIRIRGLDDNASALMGKDIYYTADDAKEKLRDKLMDFKTDDGVVDSGYTPEDAIITMDAIRILDDNVNYEFAIQYGNEQFHRSFVVNATTGEVGIHISNGINYGLEAPTDVIWDKTINAFKEYYYEILPTSLYCMYVVGDHVVVFNNEHSTYGELFYIYESDHGIVIEYDYEWEGC